MTTRNKSISELHQEIEKLRRELFASRSEAKEREKAEKALHATDEGIWEWNVKSGSVTYDENWRRILGYAPGEPALDFDWWERSIHPESKAAFETALDAYLEGRAKYYELEYQIQSKSGEWKWIWARGVCVAYDPDGRPLKFIGTHRDITDRKKTETELKQSQERFREMADNIREVFWLFDWAEQKVIYVSPAYEEIWGRSVQDLYDQYDEWADSIHPDDRKFAQESFARILETGGGGAREYRIIRPDGSIRWVSDRGFAIRDEAGQVQRITGIAEDITPRKQAEEGLRLQSQIASHMSEGVNIVREADGVIVYTNPRFDEIFGYDSGELVGRHVSVLNAASHQEPQETAREIMQACANGQCWEGEVRNVRKDGSEFWSYASISPFRDPEHGKVHITIQLDITERKDAESKLRDSEERLKLALMSAEQGFYDQNIKTGEMLVSDEYALMLGYDPSSFVETTQHWRDRLHPDDKERVASFYRAYLRGDVEQYKIEFRHRTQSGQWVWIMDLGKIVQWDEAGEPIRMLGTRTDVTEQKRLEQELLKIEKLESVGQLAGGLAHDFNNLLTAILANVSMAKVFAARGENVLNVLTEAEKASLRAKDLTHQLLTFSKGGAPVKKVASIADLVRESSAFALRGSNVRCSVVIAPDLWSAEVDPGQISQVIHNLVINADESMPEGGRVRIVCRNTLIRDATHLPLRNGKYIRISITDEGHGIPEAQLTKIFDPYFTTKQKGSGLGLATAYSIVKRHSGLIVADSRVGAGATFSIYLPASSGKESAPQEVRQELMEGHGKILIMDDEPMVRKSAALMLSSLGYEVEAARDGEEAIDLYRHAMESSLPFDAVIMDLTIPGGMGGKEAVQKIRAMDPHVKAIVSSGYSTDPVMAEPEKHGFRGVMPKPYRLKELSQMLHALLTAES